MRKRKLNYSKIKENFMKDRIIYFFIIGTVLMIFYPFITTLFPILLFIFMPFIMFPIYIINILSNLETLNLLNVFNSEYFWVFQWDTTRYLIFVFLGVISFSLFLTLVTGKNIKARRISLIFAFIFFSISLLSLGYRHYLMYYSFKGVLVGTGNLTNLLAWFSIILTNLIILNFINKEFNLRYFTVTLVKYIFTISEILLVIFIGLSFIEVGLMGETPPINALTFPIFYIVLGYFIYMILEITKKYILDKIELK